MGSYCSCSGSLKYNNGVIIPNNFINGQLEEPMGHYRKEKQEKKQISKDLKLLMLMQKTKGPIEKEQLLHKIKIPLYQVVLVIFNIKL